MLASVFCLEISIIDLFLKNLIYKLVPAAALKTLALCGKMFMSICFDGTYMFSAESFPTEVRHIGMGSSSMCARLGAMIAPYMGKPMVVYTEFFISHNM